MPGGWGLNQRAAHGWEGRAAAAGSRSTQKETVMDENPRRGSLRETESTQTVFPQLLQCWRPAMGASASHLLERAHGD